MTPKNLFRTLLDLAREQVGEALLVAGYRLLQSKEIEEAASCKRCGDLVSEDGECAACRYIQRRSTGYYPQDVIGPVTLSPKAQEMRRQGDEARASSSFEVEDVPLKGSLADRKKTGLR